MDIPKIVDYTAALAAGIQGVTLPNSSYVGVRSTFGLGSGTPDPLRPGNTIQPAPENALEPLMHVSRLPELVRRPLTQFDLTERTLVIPMTLYVQRGDAQTAAQVGQAFYEPYDDAFAADPTLGGNVLRTERFEIKPDSDESWFWLDMELEVVVLKAVNW